MLQTNLIRLYCAALVVIGSDCNRVVAGLRLGIRFGGIFWLAGLLGVVGLKPAAEESFFSSSVLLLLRICIHKWGKR